jgi:hypothetical protein
MDNYLLRTEQLGTTYSQLLFFEDDSQLTALEHLTEYLKHLILLNECSLSEYGKEYLVKAFWKWNADDSIDELRLDFVMEIPEGENMERLYGITMIKTEREIARFRVQVG